MTTTEKRIAEIEARQENVTDDMLESAVVAANMIYREQQFHSPGVYLGVVSDLQRVSSLAAVMRHDVRHLLAELRACHADVAKWRENHDNLARARREDLAKVEAECDRLRGLLSLDGEYACEIRWRRKDMSKTPPKIDTSARHVREPDTSAPDAHDIAAREVLPCLCDDAYKSRDLIAPDCPQCQFADEVADTIRRAAADAAKASYEHAAEYIEKYAQAVRRAGHTDSANTLVSVMTSIREMAARGTGGA